MPQGPQSDSLSGGWMYLSTEYCSMLSTCTYESLACPIGQTAVSGICGNSGSDDSLRVVYSGLKDGTDQTTWECRVRNFNMSESTYSVGVYCAP